MLSKKYELNKHDIEDLAQSVLYIFTPTLIQLSYMVENNDPITFSIVWTMVLWVLLETVRRTLTDFEAKHKDK